MTSRALPEVLSTKGWKANRIAVQPDYRLWWNVDPQRKCIQSPDDTPGIHPLLVALAKFGHLHRKRPLGPQPKDCIHMAAQIVAFRILAGLPAHRSVAWYEGLGCIPICTPALQNRAVPDENHIQRALRHYEQHHDPSELVLSTIWYQVVKRHLPEDFPQVLRTAFEDALAAIDDIAYRVIRRADRAASRTTAVLEIASILEQLLNLLQREDKTPPADLKLPPPSPGRRKPRRDQSSRDVWGRLDGIIRPPLEAGHRMIRLPHRRQRPSEAGILIGALDRILVDQKVFMDPTYGTGGTVLIDVSGSMSLSVADILGIIRAAPMSTIAAYCGEDDRGWIWILAERGKVVTQETLRDLAFPAGNIIDGPALEWLGTQQEPRLWVSDGHVTGVRDTCRSDFLSNQARDLRARYRIHWVTNPRHVPDAIRYLRRFRL